MKKSRLPVSVLLVGAAICAGSAPANSEENVISKNVFNDGAYCHIKFESIREATLDSSHPVLKDVDDIEDFYGPCNHDPLGKEEIQRQKIEAQHRFTSGYED